MSHDTLADLAQQEHDRQAAYAQRIFCCYSTACLSAGARDTHHTLSEQAGDAVDIVPTGCMGLCSRGPLVRVEARDKAPILYGDMTQALAAQLAAQHITHTAAAGDLADHQIPLDAPMFTKQVRVVLSEIGRINPEKLEDYLAHGGYQALSKALDHMTPQDVCDEIAQSGLRGRGGAGFPVGRKWHMLRQQDAPTKYIIVNGDEGDPGAYMDRSVMEADPHRVLEGMLICAYATGATHGYFYIRGEYPIAVKRIRRAIRAARRRGILGKSVLGTDFSFDADVRIGAGAFVCGEETALIHSVEGKRGTPRIRPPYPTESGLWGAPTAINNVETMANIPSIIQQGADWFAGIGTETSKGTKVFALTGQLRNTGLIEVPMGITLREIVEDIGGGVPDGRTFKAAQTGGPSGGCIPAEYLDTPMDYERLKALGSMMGSGGLVIIDDATHMPAFARFFVDFCVDESCGKCVPCRVGTVKMRALLDKLLAGDGTQADIEKLARLCQVVQTTSLCGLGQSAPNPVLSTLAYFRHEYDALISAD